MRIFALSAVSVVGAGGAARRSLLSFDSIGAMFDERAQLIQSYDVGSGGRFRLQELALAARARISQRHGSVRIRRRVTALQQHNVYLQAFLVYGWVGGMAYIMLLAVDARGSALRTVFVRTPWQPYLIAAFAAFVGEVLEGFVIDTDHWRHFFLLLGMVWGLAAATFNHVRDRQTPAERFSHVRA